MAKAKRVKGINCDSVATIGIKLVLVTRFEELYGFHDTALDWSDPEGVHSMRVASRRLRSALRDFLPYVRKRGLTTVQKRLKNVADALGDVRDQDLASVRAAGYSDGDIAEIIAHVALNVFTNYFNRAAHTEIDCPLVTTGQFA